MTWLNGYAQRMHKTAIVLLNLGGPDNREAVWPFLYNLFRDPAILPWSSPFRQGLAWLIATLRLGKARKIYAKLGDKSPLLANTQAQAQALSKKLAPDHTVFVGMRYWHPFIAEAVGRIKAGRFNQVVLLPLYPQFSSTTSASAFREWASQVLQQDLEISTTRICCYPTHPGFIEAYVDLIRPVFSQAQTFGQPRLLFSAHGLPQSVIKRGDPYAWQVNETARAITEQLGEGVESLVCYQSRVGPKRWLEPSLAQALNAAAQDRVPVVVVPLSFVSEHSETLIELDEEYAQMARNLNIPFYGRVPTVSTHDAFITALADLVQGSKDSAACPPDFCLCAQRARCD